MGEMSRGAAVWALGRLHENNPDEALAKMLFERLSDPVVEPPEMERVRVMSAIALGIMKTKSQVEPLRKGFTSEAIPNRQYMAVRWAMRELTGEQLPEPKPAVQTRYGWFLEPLEKMPSEEQSPSATSQTANPRTEKPNGPK